jgi:rRNA maturation protein Nop10
MRPTDEKQAIDEDDEATRLKYESCPACGEDLGADVEVLEQCPRCGEEL